jgi:hypothetical protein
MQQHEDPKTALKIALIGLAVLGFLGWQLKTIEIDLLFLKLGFERPATSNSLPKQDSMNATQPTLPGYLVMQTETPEESGAYSIDGLVALHWWKTPLDTPATFERGDEVVVAYTVGGGEVHVRKTPGYQKDDDVCDVAKTDEIFLIVDGPRRENEPWWWKVRNNRCPEGWIAQSTRSGYIILCLRSDQPCFAEAQRQAEAMGIRWDH